MLVSPAALASSSGTTTGTQVTQYVATMKRDREVIRFFERHHWLLSDPRFAAEARRQLALHRGSLARTRARRAALRRRRLARRLAVAKAELPEIVVCRVFGSYCGEALRVARCESGLRTDAQNGQYLGLFQMGVTERRLFGHGPSAEEQAKAAYRYFVASGLDWSPWSCKPW